METTERARELAERMRAAARELRATKAEQAKLVADETRIWLESAVAFDNEMERLFQQFGVGQDDEVDHLRAAFWREVVAWAQMELKAYSDGEGE